MEVVVATIDLEEVRTYRSAVSRCFQAAKSEAKYKRIQTSFALSSEVENLDLGRGPSPPTQPKYYSPEEEIALCAGCYLWDVSRGKSRIVCPSQANNDTVFEACKCGRIPCATFGRYRQVCYWKTQFSSCIFCIVPSQLYKTYISI